MEGGSRDQLQPRAGAVDHVGVSEDYCGVLIKAEMILDNSSVLYGRRLRRLRDAMAELTKHRQESLRLQFNHSNLSLLRHNLLIEHGMLRPAVNPMPMLKAVEVLREEDEKILRTANDLCIGLRHQVSATVERLKVHRLAVEKLFVCGHSFDGDEKRQAVRELLLEAKMLFRQIHASYEEYSFRLHQAMAEIDAHRVEQNDIRAQNVSLSSFICNLLHGEGTAAPTQEGGVESQVNPRSYTTKLCDNWMRGGACTYGDQCCFVHGQQELQSLVPRPRHPPYRTKPCLYFLTASGCIRGDSCSYQHGCPPPE